MQISIIAAVAENGTIGKDGTLPWHLPDDFKRVKALTIGHTLIMGRHTFDSIGKPLPRRRSIVLSRDAAYAPPGVDRAENLEQALAMAREAGETEAFLFGGAGVFAAGLAIADCMLLTIVHAQIDGDVRFPAWEPRDWTLLEDERFDPDARHAHAYSFRTFVRHAAAAQ